MASVPVRNLPSNHSLVSYNAPLAMPAAADTHDGGGAMSGVEHEQMAATAGGAREAAFGFRSWTAGHGRLRFCSSAKLTRDRPAVAVRSMAIRAAPCIDAATAQPTRQSNQWLSPRSGRAFHSSTVRPRPSVFTRYSEVRCSANNRCWSGRSPKSEKQPRSPLPSHWHASPRQALDVRRVEAGCQHIDVAQILERRAWEESARRLAAKPGQQLLAFGGRSPQWCRAARKQVPSLVP